jgi:hypothetical protein
MRFKITLRKNDLPLERSPGLCRGVNKHLPCISLSLSDAGAGSALSTLPCLALLSYITSIPKEQALLFHRVLSRPVAFQKPFPDQRTVGCCSDLISDISTPEGLGQ